MRPITLATALFVLAACFGAVIGSRGGGAGRTVATQDTAATGGGQGAEAKPAIDKKRRQSLQPVRAPDDLGATAYGHIERLVSFGPRHAADPVGRPGWTQQIAYIEQEFERLGLRVARDTWTDRKELITFSNLSVTIPGTRKDRIVIACHHDTKCTTGHPAAEHNFDFVGANDGGSGVGLLLALAPVLRQKPHEATIELVFFDGEESLDWRWNEAKRALFGSKRFVARHRDAQLLGEEPRIAAVILLDMVGR
ncbi:MAG: M28 family peptidase, partial [Planctomycetes bacterium]|nr:M28 family peptidase [Planctomycetota bacterium]